MPFVCSRTAQHERGLSLVEVMVSLAIGLIVILVVTLMFINVGHNHRFRQSQSENLNNTHNVLASFSSQLAKAGYRRTPAQAMHEAFPADSTAHANGCKFAASEAIYAVNATTLCVRYQPRDAKDSDCAGQPTSSPATLSTYTPSAPEQMMVERYFTQDNTLFCQNKNNQADIPMADGVQAIRFDFGIGSPTDSQQMRRVTAYQGHAPTQGSDAIRALRYSVLLANNKGKVTQGVTSSVCARWVKTGGDQTQCDDQDGRLYHLVSGSIMLRNLMP